MPLGAVLSSLTGVAYAFCSSWSGGHEQVTVLICMYMFAAALGVPAQGRPWLWPAMHGAAGVPGIRVVTVLSPPRVSAALRAHGLLCRMKERPSFGKVFGPASSKVRQGANQHQHLSPVVSNVSQLSSPVFCSSLCSLPTLCLVLHPVNAAALQAT